MLDGFIEEKPFAYLLIILLSLAGLASMLHVEAVFGALIAGILVGAVKHEHYEAAKIQLSKIASDYFIPLYFAIIGLNVNLIGNFDLHITMIYFVVSTIAVILPIIPGLLVLRLTPMASFNFAIAMNAKGGPMIVLASVAFSMGIISQTFFVTMLLMAIVTSLLAGAWFRLVLDRNWELYDPERRQKSTSDAQVV